MLLYSILSAGPGLHRLIRGFGSAHSLQVLSAGLQGFHEWQHHAQVSYTHPHGTQKDLFSYKTQNNGAIVLFNVFYLVNFIYIIWGYFNVFEKSLKCSLRQSNIVIITIVITI